MIVYLYEYVVEFGTPYDAILNDLKRQNLQLCAYRSFVPVLGLTARNSYKNNGLIKMLTRNASIKVAGNN